MKCINPITSILPPRSRSATRLRRRILPPDRRPLAPRRGREPAVPRLLDGVEELRAAHDIGLQLVGLDARVALAGAELAEEPELLEAAGEGEQVFD